MTPPTWSSAAVYAFHPIREYERQLLGTSDHLGEQRGCLLLCARPEVHPQTEPAAHRQSRMHPFDLLGTQFGMRLVQLDTPHRHLLDHLR
jgi:hypothetical protein